MAKATWNGTVLAESDTVQHVEGNIYFPPESVAWEHLTPGTRQYTCPWKGKSTYYDVVVGDAVKSNAAWSYDDPKEAARHITRHVAFEAGFSSDGISVER